MSRPVTLARLAFTEQARRPLFVVLLVVVPVVLITRAIAQTEPLPRVVPLPAGGAALTTMRDIHGANMAAIAIAFLAGLLGVFMIGASRQVDRRLVVAGYAPSEVILPRLLVLAAAVGIVLVVSLAVTAWDFTPRQWPAFIAGNALVAVTYACIGALAGAVLGRLGAVYLLLFAAMIDLGIAQNPMFGSARPPEWATALPGYGAGRIIVQAAFADAAAPWRPAAVAVAWAAGLVVAVVLVLRRTLRDPTAGPRRL